MGKVIAPDHEYDPKKVVKPTDTFRSSRHWFHSEYHWQHTRELYWKSLQYAFLVIARDVNLYYKHIDQMGRLFDERGNWSPIVDYNARLRLEFATRPALTFADFNSNELTHVRLAAMAAGLGFAAQGPYAPAPSNHNNHAPSHNNHASNQASGSQQSARPRASTDKPKSAWSGQTKPRKSGPNVSFFSLLPPFLPHPNNCIPLQRLCMKTSPRNLAPTPSNSKLTTCYFLRPFCSTRLLTLCQPPRSKQIPPHQKTNLQDLEPWVLQPSI